MAAALAAVPWDVLAVQELDRFVGRSGKTDQPRILMEESGAGGHFASTVSLDGGDYGIALLYRMDPPPPASVSVLEVGQGEEPRAAITIYLASGERIAATHLGAVRATAQRSLRSLMAAGDAPGVIAGDLNLDPEALPPAGSWTIAGEGLGHATFPADSPTGWIDHVLYRTDAWRESRSWTVEIPGSDHHAFFVELAGSAS